MSDEDKELLARIGELAGQINRHKNQQAGINPTRNHRSSHPRHNAHRHASAPYPARGNRVQRPRPHQHRTVQFNSSSTPSSGVSTPPAPAGWVSRNDRHRQLINANVFEKDSENRAKAIEATRKKQAHGHRSGERHRFREYLTRQQAAASPVAVPGGANVSAPSNELTIEGIRFRVLDGGKKLARVPGESGDGEGLSQRRTSAYLSDDTNPTATPKTTVIAGVKFYRTKTGNLVVNRVVKDQRRSIAMKKINEPCKIFSTSGSCPKGPQCRFIHDPHKVALCKDFLKEGRCPNGDACDLSHDMSPERVPNCLHYAKGHCAKAECPFTHSKASPSAPVCRAFGFLGYCEKGADCTERHVFECPDFSNTGRCNNKGCKLPHRERASVLRGQLKADQEPVEDISSDEGAADTDDVDSDDVAEFIDVDSDESEIEDHQDFIKL